MSVKTHPHKKSSRHKKIITAISAKHDEGTIHSDTSKSREEAIVRQFHRIQRGYSILMNEVSKEFELVKGWLEKEASARRNEFRARLSGKSN